MDATTITAVATVALVIITTYYAWQNRKYVQLIEKERKERNLKEVIANLLEPIQKELRVIADERFYGYRIPEFKWQSLKFERPSLIYSIPEELRKKLESFSKDYEDYAKHHYELIKIIQKINRKIGDKYGIDKRCECSDIQIHFPEGRLLPPRIVSLFYFIFGEEEINDFFEKYYNRGVRYAQVRFVCKAGTGESVVMNWEIERVTKLLHDVMNELRGYSEAQKILKLQKRIRKDADKLKNEILKLIKTWSEDLAK